MMGLMISIVLSNGATTVVDDEDAWAAKGRWTFSHGYAQHRVNGRIEYLHRAIAARMGFPPEAHVDHRNTNKLDNRRANLRHADKSRNSANRKVYAKRSGSPGRSQYKGVHRPGGTGPWVAYITLHGRRTYLGYTFETEEEAARAYDRAALEAFGEYARLNFSDSQTAALRRGRPSN